MRVRIGNSSIGGRVNIKSRLPAGYQEVEYIESPNAEYIDTGKTADSTSIIAFDFQYVSFNSSYNRIFGARNAEGKGLLNIRTSTTSGPYLLVENVHNWVSTTSIGTNKHSIKMDGYGHNLYYDNSVVSTNFTIKDDTLGNMWLFGTNQGGTDSNVRIFNYTHVKGGILIQKLVPCVRISDNKPGLYDTVNNEFLVNSGTGEFIVGPNVPKSVLPDEYQRVEYVEGTGTQYIDTGIKFIKGPYKMDFKFYRNDSGTNDMSIFGQRTLGKFVNTYSTYYETVFGTTTAGTLLLNQDVHMVIDSSSGIYQNGIKILNNYSNNDRSSDYSAFMFAFHENVEKAPKWFLKGRIYYYTIWEVGVVTHNFLPCYRKSDGEIGMYDVITKQFFTNQGTGTFLKGSNVVNNIGGKPHITIEGTTNLGGTSVDYSNRNYGQIYTASSWGGDKGTVTFFPSGGYNNYPYKVYHKTAIGTGGIYIKTANDIQIEAGKTYTMSVYIKANRNFSASQYSFNINRGSDNKYITYSASFPVTTEWKRFVKTFTATNADAGMYGEMSILYDDGETDYYVYYSGFQIEEKDHATPFVIGTRQNNTII